MIPVIATPQSYCVRLCATAQGVCSYVARSLGQPRTHSSRFAHTAKFSIYLCRSKARQWYTVGGQRPGGSSVASEHEYYSHAHAHTRWQWQYEKLCDYRSQRSAYTLIGSQSWLSARSRIDLKPMSIANVDKLCFCSTATGLSTRFQI